MAFNPSETAAELRKSMKGLGTNDDALIAILSRLTNEQIQQARTAYSVELQRDLVEDIKSETSGVYCDLLVGLTLTRAEFDAGQLHKAIKGLGTNEDVFIQILSHRTSAEIALIEQAYTQLAGVSLKQDIDGDFSGDGKAVALGMVSYNKAVTATDPVAVNAYVDTLYNAGEGRLGTNEEAFVQAICGFSPTWLKAVNEAYGRKHGHTLVHAVKEEFSGFAAKTLQAMVTDIDEYYADLIHQACSGLGTDEELLVRVLASRRHMMKEINNKFMEKYTDSVAFRVEKEVGGDFGKLVTALVEAA